MNIKILGPGCPRCQNLERKVRNLVEEHKLNVEIEKVTDIDTMISYGMMMSPGLVVNGVLKSSGIIPRDNQLLAWLGEGA
ncbi:MAG: thioredoxin family protein [Candidatus Marinimicrobia bacterium]|nr:thioredoxin family protein [Candidatus Neomarinimicrobiota bacterium]MCF7839862.1 thioredoxin family protein [Candidatus Neomarinimicrobiota bacterium]MCF7903449.1 thioredoxin family protein [Candidatus Neomarinimicrobiota bacterium]